MLWHIQWLERSSLKPVKWADKQKGTHHRFGLSAQRAFGLGESVWRCRLTRRVGTGLRTWPLSSTVCGHTRGKYGASVISLTLMFEGLVLIKWTTSPNEYTHIVVITVYSGACTLGADNLMIIHVSMVRCSAQPQDSEHTRATHLQCMTESSDLTKYGTLL